MRTTKQRNFAIALVCVIAVCCCAIGVGCSFASRGGSQNGDNIAQVNVQKVAYAHDNTWTQINDQASLAAFLGGTNPNGYLTTSFSVNWGNVTSPHNLKANYTLDGNGQTITFNGEYGWSTSYNHVDAGSTIRYDEANMYAAGLLVALVENGATIANLKAINSASKVISSDDTSIGLGVICGGNNGTILNTQVEVNALLQISPNKGPKWGDRKFNAVGAICGANNGNIFDTEVKINELLKAEVGVYNQTGSGSVGYVGGVTGRNTPNGTIKGASVQFSGKGKVYSTIKYWAGANIATGCVGGFIGYQDGGTIDGVCFKSDPIYEVFDCKHINQGNVSGNNATVTNVFRMDGTKADLNGKVVSNDVNFAWQMNGATANVEISTKPIAEGKIIWSFEGADIYSQMVNKKSYVASMAQLNAITTTVGATVLGEVGNSAVTSANVVYDGSIQSLKAKYYAKDGVTVVGESASLANGKTVGDYSTDGNIPALANAEKHVYVPAVTNGAVATLKVEPKPMTVTKAGTNVYDASYVIAGLVGNETINGKVNGTYQLEDTTELTFDAPANYSMAQVKVKASPYTFTYADGIAIVDKVGITNNAATKTVAINARNVTDIALSYTGNHVGHYTTLEFVGGTPSVPEKNNMTIAYTVSDLSTLTSVGLGKITSIAYNFGATAGANGKATVNGLSTTTANYGNVVTFVATADAGYHFVGWFDGNATAISFAEKYSTKAFGNKTLEARFAIDGAVKVIFKNIDGSNYKTGVANVGDVVADLGAGVTVTETQLYQTFIGWVADIQTAVIESGVTEVILTPKFSTSKNVTVKIDGVDKTYRFGQDITLTSANASSKWLVNGILASESKTFVVNAFDGLAVKEELTSATITNAPSNMTFSCEKAGDAIYFAATAVDGVKIVALGMILSNDNTFAEKVSAPAVGTIRVNVGQFVMKVDENVFGANGFITKTNFWAKGYAVVENATGQQSIIYSAAQNIK